MFHPKGPSLYELAVQALSSTDRGYDLLARKFDYTPFRTPDLVLTGVEPLIGQVERGLDVCCGTGAGIGMLRRHCTEVVVGVDRSQGMLDEARRQAEQAEGAPVRLVRGDARAMPFVDQFDVAVCFGAFGHILPEDEPAFVRSIHRALRPGGRFVFATSECPPATSWKYWVARGFNAAMHARNALIQPEFVMFYLTFMWPDVSELLDEVGFDVQHHRDVFDAPFRKGIAVVAEKRA